MSRYWERVKRNNRQYWPFTLAAVVSVDASALLGSFFGPFVSAVVCGGALVFYYRRRQVADLEETVSERVTTVTNCLHRSATGQRQN